MRNFEVANRALQWLAVLVSALLFASCGKHESSAAKKKKHRTTLSTENIFTNNTVLRLRITIPKEGIDLLRKSHWDSRDDAKRQAVKAIVQEGGKTYTN